MGADWLSCRQVFNLVLSGSSLSILSLFSWKTLCKRKTKLFFLLQSCHRIHGAPEHMEIRLPNSQSFLQETSAVGFSAVLRSAQKDTSSQVECSDPITACSSPVALKDSSWSTFQRSYWNLETFIYTC